MVDYMSVVIGIEHSIFDLIINIEGHKNILNIILLNQNYFLIWLDILIKHFTIIIIECVIACLYKFVL